MRIESVHVFRRKGRGTLNFSSRRQVVLYMYRETSTEFEWIHQNENRGDIIVLMSFLLIEWIDFPYFLDPIFNNMCVTGSEYSARQNSLSVHLELTFYSSKVHRNSRERKRKPDLDGPGRWLCQLSLRGMMGSQMVLGRTRHTKTDFSIPCFFVFVFFFRRKGGGWVIVLPCDMSHCFELRPCLMEPNGTRAIRVSLDSLADIHNPRV